ncbi:hypothetical protein QAD02_014895 [Eretmocerus hayati]|uniref:Uncharacterized protein n=1 Tax=Eretmocerus hayati TaxID=131215 RepID=A0ACC2P7N2_9HYME|nr:hypothetical protein QAD02_014895 [Eretmocerus hayati]
MRRSHGLNFWHQLFGISLRAAKQRLLAEQVLLVATLSTASSSLYAAARKYTMSTTKYHRHMLVVHGTILKYYGWFNVKDLVYLQYGGIREFQTDLGRPQRLSFTGDDLGAIEPLLAALCLSAYVENGLTDRGNLVHWSKDSTWNAKEETVVSAFQKF